MPPEPGCFINDEMVPLVPGKSIADIQIYADVVLGLLCPESLDEPRPVDLVSLVETGLQTFNIFVMGATADELGDRHAATDYSPNSRGKKIVLVNEDLLEDLYAGGPRARFARSTVAHELGHAFMHVDFLRDHRRKATMGLEEALARRRRDEIKPWRDPEWQAHTFAGCFIAPRRSIEVLAPSHSLEEMAALFQISVPFMAGHLRRMKLEVNTASHNG